MPKISSKNTYYDLTKRFEDTYGNVYDPTNLDLKLWLKANDTVATVGGFPVTRNAAEIELNQHISKKQYPAFRKTGASSSLSIADAKDLYFPSTESFTLSMWIYHPPGWTTSSHGFIRKGHSIDDNHEWEVFFVHSSNNGYIMLRIWDESQNASVYRYATNLNSGFGQDASSPGWKHWVFTDHSTNTGTSTLNDAKIYLNGAVLSTSVSSGGSFVESEDLGGTLKIGLGISIANAGAETKFAEIAIWKSELSLTQIKAIYNATKEGVIRGYEQSGFTTQNPRVVLEINDNMEDNSYQAVNQSLLSRNLIGRSFRDSKFDDTKSLHKTSRKRCEVISIIRGNELQDKMKFYIRGADGLSFKTFAICSSDPRGWSARGGLSASDIKVDVTNHLQKLDPRQRSNESYVSIMIANALGEAIAKESSLKLDVNVKYNQIYLKDQNVDKITVSSFGDVKPPRALHHPRVRLKVLDGDKALSGDFAELQSVTFTDGQGTSRKYVIVDSSKTSVTTGTILVEGSDYGTGTLSAGHTAIGGIAVAVDLATPDTENALLVQLKAAIEHKNGHNGRLLVQNVPTQANGVQLVTVMSAVPPLKEGSSFSFSENIGGSSFTITSDEAYFHKIQRPVSKINITDGDATSSLPAEKSSITIVTGDGTSKKYVTVIGASTTVETGEILSANSDTGAQTAGAGNAGAIAVALGSTRGSYLRQLMRAITSNAGHGNKIKVINQFGTESSLEYDGIQEILLTDMTSGPYVPDVGSPVRSVTETDSVASVTVINWEKSGVSGGKIVESIFGVNNSFVRVDVVNSHGINPEMTHGANHTKDTTTKNILVGHNTMPDLISSVSPSPGSGYDSLIELIQSGSSNPFTEEGLFESFSGEPGKNVVFAKSRLTRKGEGISKNAEVGRGFQSDISSKECITIEIDGSAGSETILYPAGSGVGNEARPTMAYINPATGQWTALGGDRIADVNFPGNTGTYVKPVYWNATQNLKEEWDYTKQITERAHIGFGQGQRNMFRMITAPQDGNGSVVLGSLNMSAESLEAEKDRYAFIESNHNPCINSFGFPSHPKFCAANNLLIDMSKYIDDDFLVESIAVDAKITTQVPFITRGDLLDESKTYAQRVTQFAEIVPSGCTFFLLNQRKSFLPIGISQNTFHMETDRSGATNLRTQRIDKNNLSIPGWYPRGARQAWSRGTAPASVIYNAGAASTVNGDDHANSTGWSFKAVASNGSNADFTVTAVQSENRLQVYDGSFITTSTAEDTYHNDTNTDRENAPPYYMPIPEGYSTASYLTTSEAYRLRILGYRAWSGSNTEAKHLYIYVYATYIDQLLAGDADGVRNLVTKIKISNVDTVYDIPLRTVFDGKDRKFNLHISFHFDDAATHGDNFMYLRAAEIYRVETSSYVDTIRDVVGWGTVGVFPNDFEDKVVKNLATRARDPRDSYELVINDSVKAERPVVVSFPAKAPAYGDYGTIAVSGSNQIITNWDSMGRSGVSGIPSDRSVVCGTSPGVESDFMTRQYFSKWKVAQAKKAGITSPYLLKKSDKLILGAQSLTNYHIPHSASPYNTPVSMLPSKVRLKLYGSRISNSRGSSSQTKDNLSSNSVHQTIGNDPVLDQFETEPNYMYEGTYLDHIIVGNPNLNEYLRGGEMIDLGIPRSYTGDVIGLSVGTYDLGKKRPHGFAKYGDFNPFLPSFTSVNAAGVPNTFPANEKFLVKDQNGVSKIYVSSTAVSAGSPSQNGSTTATVDGVTAPAIRFYNGGTYDASSNPDAFQVGVRELALAINHSNGHNGGSGHSDHLMAVESTFQADVLDKKHIVQIIPRVISRDEADLYDSGALIVSSAYKPASDVSPYWTNGNEPRFEHLGGASIKASGLALVGHAHQWNWHRKTKDFNRGVVARTSFGTAGITGSFQKFVQLKEDSVFKYDSLVIPTYEFLSMFDVVVPWNQGGTSNDGSQHDGNVLLGFTGSFLPIFQRCQIINQLGGNYTGRGRIGTVAFPATHASNPGEVAQREDDETFQTRGWDKNVTNLWSRWPFERGDRRSIDVLNPTTFRCDVFGTYRKGAQPIVRVQVPDMNRLDGARYSSGSATYNVGTHYSASLVGFGRGNATWVSEGSATDGIASHKPRVPKIQGESEFASYSPRDNPDIAKKTLKCLFGFETSHYMRWGTTPETMHKASNGNEYVYYRVRFRDSFGWGMTSVDATEIAERISRSHIVVRGMRYGIDNYIPTEDKIYMRHNRYGQFRDMLEQRKLHVSCGPDGVATEDKPVEIQYVSRPVFDDLGNISSNRVYGVDPASTNSQNLSLHATASVPYFDDWETSAIGKNVWQYGRDRDTVQPDAGVTVTSIQAL